MIPKTIHYCWFGGNPYPPLVEQCIDSWKGQLPDYQIKRWDESNSPIDHCRFAQHAFKIKRWAFVADYVRLYALYHEGGIYLDTDMFVLKSFDPLLHHGCFLGLEEPGRANAAIVGAVRNHGFIGEMLQQYESLKSKRLVLIPRRFTDVLQKNGMSSENVLQEVFGVHVYPTDYFYPLPFREHRLHKDFKSFITANSYAVHLWNESWKTAADLLEYGQYEEDFPKVWEEIRKNPFQSLKFYRKTITHGIKFLFQKMFRALQKQSYKS